MKFKRLKEDLLLEMSNVRGNRVKLENIEFSFYFSIKNSNHSIRVKICWNKDKIIPQELDAMKLSGNYELIKNKQLKKRPDESKIEEARQFFKKYKVLFAACWDDKLQPADVVDYLEGHIDFRELLKNFYGINNYHKLLDSNDVTELYNIVKKYNIFNLYDGRLVE